MAVADIEVTETLVRKERSLFEESMIRLIRNKVAVISGVFIILLLLAAIFAHLIAPFDYASQDLLQTNAVPRWMLVVMPKGAENYVTISDKFPLGADHLGRDLLSRTLVWGAGFAQLCNCRLPGEPGYRHDIRHDLGLHRWAVDDIMMRVVDFLYAFPFLVVVILLQTYFKALERRGGTSFILILTTAWAACSSCSSPLA
jgi:ABC-type dipeptide/oligopeptide/nickel transport system permease subunit